MPRLSITEKLNIFIVGFGATLLLFLLIEVVFAQILSDFIINNVDDNLVLMGIILGLMVIILIISIIVGFLLTENVKKITVYKVSIMSFISTMFIVLIVSYTTMLIFYPDTFSEVSGIGVLIIFPQVLVYFAIYVLSNIIFLYIFILIVYFVCFIVFLDHFYEYNPYNYTKVRGRY